MAPRFLALVLLAPFVLGACLGRRPVPEGASGEEIWVLQNCKLCHEADGSGSRRGPALSGLREHWTQDDLVDFFFDPDPFEATNARLRQLEKQSSLSMPRYHNLTEEQRRTLAAWVLERF